MDEDDSQDELINRPSKGKRATAWAISDNSDDGESDEENESESGEDDEDEENLDEEDDEDEDEEDEEEEGEEGEARPEEEGACAGTSADAEISSDEESEKCPICLHSFSRQPVATPENCEHYFCLDCILEWSKNANSCPIDRKNFKVIYLRTCFGGKVQKVITIQKPAKQCEQDSVDLTLEETSCEVCGGSDREDRLLLCDGCDAGYHMECLTPPLDAVPVEEWFCPECDSNNRRSRGSATETSDTDSLPSTARTASRHTRSHNGQTRAIARTQHSERVRANVNRHRITQARTQELAPTYLIRSTWLDETINAVVAGLNSAVYVRDLTPRPSTRHRKGRKTKARKNTSKSKKGKATSTGVKRRKRKVRRTKSRRKLLTKKTPTPRSRIANSLGMVKDKRGSSLPTVYRPSESTLSSMRADIGAASLSIYGDPFDLDPFTDREDDNQQSHDSVLLEAKRRGISRSAFRSHQPVARPVGLTRRPMSIPQANSVVEAAPVPDLLGSILSGQSMLLMDSSDVIINRDGTLKASKPISFTNRIRSGSRGSSSGDGGPLISPTSLPDHVDRLESSDSSIDRHSSSPLSSPLGSTLPTSETPHSVQPRGNPSLLGTFSFDHNRPNQRVGLHNGLRESRQNGSSPLHVSSDSKSKTLSQSHTLKAPTKPMWMDVSVLPRIPKIKRESSSDEASFKTESSGNQTKNSSSSSNSSQSHDIPDAVINRLAGDNERGHSVDQQQGRGAGPRNRPDGAGSSSGFSSSFSSSAAASHTNHQRFSSGSSSSSASVSFRINTSGNSWHSRRLNIGSLTPSGSNNQENFTEEEKKRQLHRDKQKLLASRSKDSNNIYDPFNPTESDSGSSDGESGNINVESSSRLKHEPVKLKNKGLSKSRWDLKQVKVETSSLHSQNKPITSTAQGAVAKQINDPKVKAPLRKSRFSDFERPSPFNTVLEEESVSNPDEEKKPVLNSETRDRQTLPKESEPIMTVKQEQAAEPPAASCDGSTTATFTSSPVKKSPLSPVKNLPSPTRKASSSSIKKSSSSPTRKSTLSSTTKPTSSLSKKSSSPSRRSSSSSTNKSVSSPTRKSASSPTRKSTPSPTRKSTSCSARKSLSSPSRRTASSPSRKSASSPSRKSASSPSRKSASSPSRKSASSPSRKSASSPSRKSASSPSRKSASSPSRKSASSPSRKSASSPSRKSASSPSRKSASSPSRKSASSPSRKSASSPSRKSASSPSRKPAASPSRKPALSPSRKSAKSNSSPSWKSASSPSRKSASSPARRSALSPARKSASSPARKSASSPSRKSASSPSRMSTSSPSRKLASSPIIEPTSSPTKKPTLSPVHKPTSSSNQKSMSSLTNKPTSSPTRISAISLTGESTLSSENIGTSSLARKIESITTKTYSSSPVVKSSSPTRKSVSSPNREMTSSPSEKSEKMELKYESPNKQSTDLSSEKSSSKKNLDQTTHSNSTGQVQNLSSPDRELRHGSEESKRRGSVKDRNKAKSSRRSRSKEKSGTHKNSDSSPSKSPDRTSKKKRCSRSKDRRTSRSSSSSSSRERSRTKRYKNQSKEKNDDKDVKRSTKDKRRDRSRSKSRSKSRSRSRERKRVRSRSRSISRSRSRSRERKKSHKSSRDQAELRVKEKKRHKSRSSSREKNKKRTSYPLSPSRSKSRSRSRSRSRERRKTDSRRWSLRDEAQSRTKNKNRGKSRSSSREKISKRFEISLSPPRAKSRSRSRSRSRERRKTDRRQSPRDEAESRAKDNKNNRSTLNSREKKKDKRAASFSPSRSKSRSRSGSRSRERRKNDSRRQSTRDEAESRMKVNKRHRSRSNSRERRKDRRAGSLSSSRSKSRSRSRSRSRERKKTEFRHQSSRDESESRAKYNKRHTSRSNSREKKKNRAVASRSPSRSKSRSRSRSRSKEKNKKDSHPQILQGEAKSHSKDKKRPRSRSNSRDEMESHTKDNKRLICTSNSKEEVESCRNDRKRHRSRSNSQEKKKEGSDAKTQKVPENCSSSKIEKNVFGEKSNVDSFSVQAEIASNKIQTNIPGSTSPLSFSVVKKEPMDSKANENPANETPADKTFKADNPIKDIKQEKCTVLDIFKDSPTCSPFKNEEVDTTNIQGNEIKCMEDTETIQAETCQAEKLGATSPEKKESVSDSPVMSFNPPPPSALPQDTIEQNTEHQINFVKQEPPPLSSDSDDDFNVDVMLDNLDLIKSRLTEPTVSEVKAKNEEEAVSVSTKSKTQVKRVTWNIEEPVGPQPEKSASKVALYKLKLKQEGIRRPTLPAASQDLSGTACAGDVTNSNINLEQSSGSDSSHALSASLQGEGDDGDMLKKDKTYLKKLHMQERAVEEVKLAIKPFYQKRDITKEEYKEILRKAVQKVCHSKSGEINPVKVGNLVKAYVDKYRHERKFKKDDESGKLQEFFRSSDSP